MTYNNLNNPKCQLIRKAYPVRRMVPKLIRREQGSQCLFLANALLTLPQWTTNKANAQVFVSAPCASVHAMTLALLHPSLSGQMQVS